MGRFHNTDFPGHVTGDMYEYRGIAIYKRSETRFVVDVATRLHGIPCSSLEWAKRVIDKLRAQY